jgi:hypothetical protein
VGTLLAAGRPELAAAPLPLSGLMAVPSVAGKAAFPDALHAVGGAETVAEPSSGAVR